MKLIIKTNPDNWDESIITAVGVMSDGYTLNSSKTTLVAKQLPKKWIKVWHGVVEMLKAGGDGEVVCIMATAKPTIIYPEFEENENGEIIETSPKKEAVELVTHWNWPDGRMTPTQTNIIDEANAVAVVDYLLTEKAYEKK